MEYHTQEQRQNDIEDAVKGMNLNEKEQKFLKWLSGWDSDTVYSFISILSKARAE